jgi:hypothetical protein
MPGAMDQRYFQEPLAVTLERERAEAREKRRITYDCFSCVLVDGMVICRKNTSSAIFLL